MSYEPNWTVRKTYSRWDQPAALLGADNEPAPDAKPAALAEPAAPKPATTRRTPAKRTAVKGR